MRSLDVRLRFVSVILAACAWVLLIAIAKPQGGGTVFRKGPPTGSSFTTVPQVGPP
jgi:hypothetical protein